MNFTNKLINEKSPYLLQHAHNPVNWYPWGKEAFSLAKRLDKPIFLSIGYATCHWCHVMERESFEDVHIAEIMNQAFICIKVDREERPDIDAIYMQVCQMMNGSGGWPLNVLLTPDLKPFYAGTYFPKTSIQGRIGMKELAQKTIELWKEKKSEVMQSSNELTAQLNVPQYNITENSIDKHTYKKTFHELASTYDARYGGFGSAPKFLIPHNLTFLLRSYMLSSNNEALEMVTNTLNAMRLGGIYDHIGFGFHRYSTDAQWILPHFEKMLYDQAQMLITYSEAYSITKNQLYKNTAEQIVKYISTKLTSQDGAFYSAEDADSDGEEGKFYIWNIDEIRNLLPGNTEFFCDIFNIKKEGNFRDERTGLLTGKNIPHISDLLEHFCEKMNLNEEELFSKIELCRDILYQEREKRKRPFLDDKILTDWNGLCIAALSIYSGICIQKDAVKMAEKATKFILNNLLTNDGKLLHRYRDGEAGINAMLDDYAFFIYGLLSLYKVIQNIEYLNKAIELTKIVQNDFEDKQNGGFYFNAHNSEQLIARKKDIYDGAIPSGNSIMHYNLLALYKLTGNYSYKLSAEKSLKLFSEQINSYPYGYTQFINSTMLENEKSGELVLVVDTIDIKVEKFIREINKLFLPDLVFIVKTNENAEELEKISEYTKEMKMIETQATVYLCKNFACQLPETDLEKVLTQIKKYS